jgi:Icc-related predicted phosphoesterase
MKYLIIPDLHGQKPRIFYKGFEAIIAPGDFCDTGRLTEYAFEVLKRRRLNPKYKGNWYDIAGKKNSEKIVANAIRSGRSILKYLSSFGVPVYVIPGNHDFAPSHLPWEFLKKDRYGEMIDGIENIVDVNMKIIDTGEHQIIGYGNNARPEYPMYNHDMAVLSKKELRKKGVENKKIFDRLSRLFSKAKKGVIFNAHNVPFKTKLDIIINKNSPNDGLHFGSLIAKKVIEKYQPLVCVSGHMHEHFGKDMVGKTVCIDSGYGPKFNILLDLQSNNIKKLSFHGKQV